MTSVVTSGSLDATLTDRILFTATDKANEIELQSMSFADGARGQTNTFDIRQQLVAVSNVESYRLAYDQQKNFFTADGPGWLTDIRRGESPLKRRQPGRDPKPKVDSNQLYYSRVDFQRGAQGDLNKNEVHFVGRVRGVYGPIHDWSGRLVLDRNRPLSKDIFVLNCDHLIAAEFGQSIEGEEVYDFIAQGNAFIQSAEFDARGDRVSYSQAKDLAVLEGNPREDATLRRHARAGRLQAQQAAARRIFYSPSRDDVRVDDVRQIELSQ